MNQAIVEILRAAESYKDLPKVVDRLRQFEEEELFDTLFNLSVQRQGNGLPVAFAAYALNELNPKCSLDSKAAMAALIPEWDISIEEVVFYLMKQFGLDAMQLARKEIMTEYDEPPIRLETIRYWGNIWLEKEYALRQKGSPNV